MVMNRGNMKRKRKSSDVNILLDESPKRTKVQAQRKFAQGSNVNSPVLTPIEEIEIPEHRDVLPEPQEFLPNAKRPPTEDFLTFLCFRGTPILSPSLNCFNTAPVDSRAPTEPLNVPTRPSPIATGINLASGSNSSPNSRPFIAFGVRKRADPVVISKQMDRKRRHALALRALRRKYQEQKMAKIRAITISKLSEKVSTTKNVVAKDVVRTRSVTKTEAIPPKKRIPQKAKVKVVATKRLKVTTQNVKKPIHSKIKPKMCLRSFRGRFVQCELSVKRAKKKPLPPKQTPVIDASAKKNRVSRECKENDDVNESSEFSSDDDVPLVKSVRRLRPVRRLAGTKIARKTGSVVPKKPADMNLRLTRSARLNTAAHRKVIYTKSNALRPRHVIPNKANPSKSNVPERRRTRAQIISEVSKLRRTLTRNVKLPTPKPNTTRTKEKKAVVVEKVESKNEENIKQTRSKTLKQEEAKEIINKKVVKRPAPELKKKITSQKQAQKSKTNEKDQKTVTGSLNQKEIKTPANKDKEERVKRVIKSPLLSKAKETKVKPKESQNKEVNITKEVKDQKKGAAEKKSEKIEVKSEKQGKIETKILSVELKKTEVEVKKENEEVKPKDNFINPEKAVTLAQDKLKAFLEKESKDILTKKEFSSEGKDCKPIIKKENRGKSNKCAIKKEEANNITIPTNSSATQNISISPMKEKLKNLLVPILEKKDVEKSKSYVEVKLTNIITSKSDAIAKIDNLDNLVIKNCDKTDLKKEKSVSSNSKKENLDGPISKKEVSHNLNSKKEKSDISSSKKEETGDPTSKKEKIENTSSIKEKIDGTNAKKEKSDDPSFKKVKNNSPNSKIVNADNPSSKKDKIDSTTSKLEKSDTSHNKKEKSDCPISKRDKGENLKSTKSEIENTNKEKSNTAGKSDASSSRKEKLEIAAAKKEKCEVVINKKEKTKIVIKSDKAKASPQAKRLDKSPPPQVSQRPSRKTKEAAAIYMEILSHKLVNEDEIDEDNESIDSFPELPNVRKTEQRENELKAKAKNKDLEQKSKSTDQKSKNTEIKSNSLDDTSMDTDSQMNELVSGTLQMVAEKLLDKSDLNYPSFSPEKTKTNIKKIEQITKAASPKKLEASTIIDEIDASGEDEEDSILKNKKKRPLPKKDGRKTKLRKNEVQYSSDSEESVSSQRDNVKKFPKSKLKNINDSFNDSDEEPLSKLTNKKPKLAEKPVVLQPEILVQESQMEQGAPVDAIVQDFKAVKRKSEEMEKPTYSQKREKRECAKRPQNYLTIFSSSDDEDKLFLGFVKNEAKVAKTNVQVDEPKHDPPTYDLLCKDIGRRFGKGKVNMSTEQIEQWLQDSEKAGMGLKKDNEDMHKYSDNLPIEISTPNVSNISDQTFTDNTQKKSEDKDVDALKSQEVSPASDTFSQNITSTKPQANERKTIFRKEKKLLTPNVNAFSASNESSVYAFEAEHEDSVSTPFRRPSRRPSSTATFNSEDDASKDELKTSGKFRLPATLRNEVKLPNKEVLVSDDSNSNNIEIEDSSKQPPKIQKASYSPVNPMFPPGNFAQKHKSESKTICRSAAHSRHADKSSESVDDFKYKIPSSPSASSSSSAKVYSKRYGSAKPRTRLYECVTPVTVDNFPDASSVPQMVEAPVFHPTEKEFQDPIEYIEKIRTKAEKFGICRIVPPSTFKPECKVSDDMRFTSYNQYVNKMLHRWGPNFKELMAIKKYLKTQNITLNQSPWIGGMEVDLPRLYQTVQTLGGLKEVIEKKKWSKVSDAMKIPKCAQDRVTKLDDIYCKYLLPYDTLSPAEREKLFDEVETDWAKRESRTLVRAQQKLEKSESSPQNSDSESEDEYEECIVKGRNMALSAFYRIARNTMSMWFKTAEPLPQEVEQEFWKHVTMKQNHICVHSGSIDSGNWGYGFAVSKNSPFARHAWNLKVLTNNSGSVLRSMGPLMGVTVPTLHVGMVFSTVCWYRDPHGLPWIEYLHTGGRKIWYAIPDSASETFHSTLLKLVPNYCRNKSIWLPSDTVMIPPNLLVENGVSLSRTVQQPGEYVVIFPKVFSSSLCTGYVVSESVYIAPPWWLQNAESVFNELRKNCEPSMFSFDRLLISITLDARSNVEVLKQIQPALEKLCLREKEAREKIKKLGVAECEKLPLPDAPGARKRKKHQGGEGDFECEVCRTNLFVTLVNEMQYDLIYCVNHAIDYIDKKKLEVKNCKLMYTYDDDELLELTDRLKNLIQSKLQKKVQSKFAGMPTLLK